MLTLSVISILSKSSSAPHRNTPSIMFIRVSDALNVELNLRIISEFLMYYIF